MALHATKLFRQLLLLTAIIALGIRSLIPAGYMPDFSGQGKGLLPLIICDGFDHVQKDMDEDMDMPMGHAMPMHGHGHKHSGGLCPFGINTLVINAPDNMDMAMRADYGTAPIVPLIQEMLAKQAAFSIAAPRAPPFFS